MTSRAPNVSILLCTLGRQSLADCLASLGEQSRLPGEVVIVYRCDSERIRRIAAESNLDIELVSQGTGYYTHALNLGLKYVQGDVILFTDDDTTFRSDWVESYTTVFQKLPRRVGCVSGPEWPVVGCAKRRILPPDLLPEVRLYRWFVRPWLEPPLEKLKSYRLGIYLDKKMTVSHGPYIPSRLCYSLPYRGANMAIRKEALGLVDFPEHTGLVRGLGNEQYAGLQLILGGYQCIFNPSIGVFHTVHPSLSRQVPVQEGEVEKMIMKSFYRRLLDANSQASRSR